MRRFHQCQDALRGFSGHDSLEEIVRQDDPGGDSILQAMVERGEGGFGDKDGGDLAAALQRFFEKVQTFSDAEAAIGQRAARYGFADFLQGRILGACQRLHTVDWLNKAGPAGSSRQIIFTMKWIIGVGVLLLVVAAPVAYLSHIASEIQKQSTADETHAADAIIVLGAAEYRGRPSPVLEARLNHALWLYLKGMAPRIITTGGAGGDPLFTEGSVGRAYLAKRGVPAEAIVVENEGESTAQSVTAVAEIMERMDLHSAIVVSDGYHIYRVKEMLRSRGVQVYGSPRPSIPPGGLAEKWLYFKQAVGYGLWRVGIAI
jgi:uncharacterized SAM-binding protein YcdF (DUF218 family)